MTDIQSVAANHDYRADNLKRIRAVFATPYYDAFASRNMTEWGVIIANALREYFSMIYPDGISESFAVNKDGIIAQTEPEQATLLVPKDFKNLYDVETKFPDTGYSVFEAREKYRKVIPICIIPRMQTPKSQQYNLNVQYILQSIDRRIKTELEMRDIMSPFPHNVADEFHRLIQTEAGDYRLDFLDFYQGYISGRDYKRYIFNVLEPALQMLGRQKKPFLSLYFDECRVLGVLDRKLDQARLKFKLHVPEGQETEYVGSIFDVTLCADGVKKIVLHAERRMDDENQDKLIEFLQECLEKLFIFRQSPKLDFAELFDLEAAELRGRQPGDITKAGHKILDAIRDYGRHGNAATEAFRWRWNCSCYSVSGSLSECWLESTWAWQTARELQMRFRTKQEWVIGGIEANASHYWFSVFVSADDVKVTVSNHMGVEQKNMEAEHVELLQDYVQAAIEDAFGREISIKN